MRTPTIAGVALASLLLSSGLFAQRAQPAQTPASGAAELAVLVTTDEQNPRPMRRASVSLQAGELGVPRTAVTDDDGRVVFVGLPAGNYLLSAAKPGYVRTFYGSRTVGMGPGVAVALIGAARQEVTMKLVRGAVVTGTIRTPAGRAATGIAVQAVSRRFSLNREVSLFSETMNMMATTDDRGVYRIYGLPPGDYVVNARGGLTRDEIRAVTEQELQWADKVVAGGAAGAPASDPAAAPSSAPPSAFAPVYYPGTTVAADAVPVTLGPGEERGGVDFPLQLVRTAQIRGRLIDEGGRPQPNQNISVRAPQLQISDTLQFIEAAFGNASARTSADGSFVLSAVRPGRYTITARATPRTGTEPPAPTGRGGISEASALFGMGAGTHWASEDVDVAGVDINDLTLVLRPGMTVSGRVTYEATTLTPPKDMSTLTFSLSPAQTSVSVMGMAMSMMEGATIRTNADGTFTANGVAPGRYRFLTQAAMLGAIAPAAAASAGGFVLKSATVGGRDIADTPIDIRPGQDLSGIVVTFTDRPTEISGTVFDQAGRVTPHFPIVIFSTDRGYWTVASRRVQLVRPASDGKFRAVGLPAGEYFVCAVTAVEQDQLADPAFLDQLAAASFRIALKDGEKKTQDLKLGGG